MSAPFQVRDPRMSGCGPSPGAARKGLADRHAGLAVTWAMAVMTASAAMVANVSAEEPRVLPEITVGGPPPGSPAAGKDNNKDNTTDNKKGAERCVDVTIGNDTSMGCLNERLKRKVDEVNPPVLNIPPIDAKSSDLKVGTVNVPGVQQQYGKNFGHSAVPYRPPPVFFSPPAGGRR
jgi:hypothetical protein